MSLGKPLVDSKGEPLNNPQQQEKERNDFYDIIGKIIDMGVKIVGVIPYTIARILDNFIDNEKGGIKVLGAA
ncbi:MAG: hypothetical protein M3O33_04455, partial [Cyanobacteriota bacterium]|nr:hypothetical protein [Cyanobacteriota bacterium]